LNILPYTFVPQKSAHFHAKAISFFIDRIFASEINFKKAKMKTLVIFLILTISIHQLIAQEIYTVKSGNAELEVTIYPKENAETIIFLHGGPGAPAKFTKEISYVKDQYQVINFDQRDAGYSTCQKCNFTLEEYITDIKSIMTHFNIEKVHLFGHSWGGAYAQIFMEAHPELVKSVFLSSPSSGIGEQWKEMQKEVMMYNKRKSTKKRMEKNGHECNSGFNGL
jgi:pimeloyl-ACP methyl ester carboxylesterase